ncbi:MAG TPA: hypothetical protein VGI81_00065 [Tepidisphaeraceae bacterium]|jgi:hypothetical protein
MRSVHDNVVYSYIVECEDRRIVLHTQFRDGAADEYTDVVFTGVVAHHFECVLPGNILFDVTETSPRAIIQTWSALFAAQKNYGWPNMIHYRDVDDLIGILDSGGVRGFEIGSSLGLGGWVLATAMELQSHSAPVQSSRSSSP